MLCRKCFAANERHYNLEADIEKKVLGTFDDDDDGGDEEKEEVKAEVTGAGEGVRDSPPSDVCMEMSKKQ